MANNKPNILALKDANGNPAFPMSHSSAIKMAGESKTLTQKMEEIPEVKEVSDSGLYFGDINGNVVVTFENGHIKTKKFDSHRVQSNKFLHFSLDDVVTVVSNLEGGSYSSIFEQPTLHILKRWHDTYGIVVSLYCQRQMGNIPSKYAQEFIENKGWLKFGWHGNGSEWVNATYEFGLNQWNTFVAGVMQSVGDFEIIDRVPRLDYFHATENACKGLRDANCGCLGFLGCDDWSYNKAVRGTNYYLTDEQSTWLDTKDRLYDANNHLTFFKTDFRLEQIVQRWNNVNALKQYYRSAEGAAQAYDLIVFSHETYMSNSAYLSYAESIFQWANEIGYRFDFPMNVLLK